MIFKRTETQKCGKKRKWNGRDVYEAQLVDGISFFYAWVLRPLRRTPRPTFYLKWLLCTAVPYSRPRRLDKGWINTRGSSLDVIGDITEERSLHIEALAR